MEVEPFPHQHLVQVMCKGTDSGSLKEEICPLKTHGPGGIVNARKENLGLLLPKQSLLLGEQLPKYPKTWYEADHSFRFHQLIPTLPS